MKDTCICLQSKIMLSLNVERRFSLRPLSFNRKRAAAERQRSRPIWPWKPNAAAIDTAPSLSEQNVTLLEQADLVIIPVRPSPSDLWAVAETVSRVLTAGKPFLFAITQAKPQATITAQAVATLSQHGPVCQPFVCDRVIYASVMTGGNTAPEIVKGHAEREIAALWQEIKSVFHKKMKYAKKVIHG
jgi:chromosome partitioning protein